MVFSSKIFKGKNHNEEWAAEAVRRGAQDYLIKGEVNPTRQTWMWQWR
jgi:PleD family two-component response regulator